jgi:hypothetical protein
MSNTLEKTAEELARIMVEHLGTLSPKERKAGILAGEKVLQGRIKGFDAGSSGKTANVSSKPRIVRRSLPARGR